MSRKPPPIQALQYLPRQWAVAILATIILYVVIQPIVNRQFGWKLPSLATIAGNSASETIQRPRDAQSKTTSTATSIESESPAPEEPLPSESATENFNDSTNEDSEPFQSQSDPQEEDRGSSSVKPAKSTDQEQSSKEATTSARNDPSLKYGILKETGNQVFVSPAGLRYTRGSEEGHRLKHIERHLKDDPNRPGKHGVFEGDMPQVLRWIDDAYTRGKQSAKGVRKYEDGERTIMEATFPKAIGYVGGRDGGRAKKPEAKRLRLVLEGDRVITAFPF